MSHALLRCDGLTKRFGGLVALDAFDIEIRRGETIGLVGPNGSGKTTFFNVVTGLYDPTAGSIRLDDRDLFGSSPQVRSRRRCENLSTVETDAGSERFRQHCGRFSLPP
jgi:branched-chain amino acid transport system ATP-binding protein